MQTEKIVFDDRVMYQLSCGTDSIIVDMNNGMNVSQYVHNGKNIINYSKERYLSGKTYGIPILFPTPNRITNLTYSFLNQNYPGREHGLVRNEPFQFVSIETSNTINSISISGSWELQPEHPLFDLFPWRCQLILTITLSPSSLSWQYTVKNMESQKSLGFGLGIHPFFSAFPNLRIGTTAPYFMEASETGYPNGNILSVTKTHYDLRNPIDPSTYNFDTVYFDPNKAVIGKLIFQDNQELTLIGSEEFKHLVVYTPKDSDFICLENQTCSPDTHNLYAQGYTSTSGLIILNAGCSYTGRIQWDWK